MERLSYKGGCGIGGRMHIKTFERRAGLGYRYVNGYGLLAMKCYLKQLYH